MKKIISIFVTILLLAIVVFNINAYAATLDTINIATTKTTVRPNEEVEVVVEFGQTLGAYTFSVNYDKNIFEYVSVDGGEANDTTDKVKITYHDTTGGSNSRTNMKVKFKAKADITTSNPTEFTVTGEGFANSDGSVTFDDITTPIVKNVTVEPEYVNYTLKLDASGTILKGEEKEMKISYSSPMGHYYEHARLIAEAVTPSGADVGILATDSQGLEHDIIQSGWGDAQGFKIGGKDVLQELQVRGIFSEAGNYAITLKLIDRDNSDSVISQETFEFTVLAAAEEQAPTPPQNVEQKPVQPLEPITPTKLPKTGNNVYLEIMAVLIVLYVGYIYCNKKK